MTETWKDIPGYEGLYEVSDCGNVRSLNYYRTNETRQIAQTLSNGYAMVHLRKNGKTRYVRVHRLVLSAFKGTCPDGMEACHNNGNKLDNHIGNLRWDTRKNNNQDRVLHGTNNYGATNGRARLTDEVVILMRKLSKCGVSRKDLRFIFDVKPTNLRLILGGQTWKHLPV